MEQIAMTRQSDGRVPVRSGGGGFRRKLAAVLGPAAIVVAGVFVAPQAASAFPIVEHDDEVAYVAAVTNHLVLVDPDGTTHDTFRTVAPGSNPTIGGLLSNGGYVAAFREATTGQLWLSQNGATPASTGLNVAANTTPSVAAVGLGGGYVVTFIAPDNHLWIYDSRNGGYGTPIGFFDNGVFQGITVAAGSSSVIATREDLNYEIAFVNFDNVLWRMDGIDNTIVRVGNTLGVEPGTSPSISQWGPGGIHVSFVAFSERTLWQVNGNNWRDTGLGVAPGGSPSSINTWRNPGGSMTAFRAASTNHLWYMDDFDNGGARTVDTGYTVREGTNPSAAAWNTTNGQAFFIEATTGALWSITNGGSVRKTGLLAAPGFSPAATSLFRLS
jgi:hypothetical protein